MTCQTCKGEGYTIEDYETKELSPCPCKGENFDYEPEWADIVARATAEYLARSEK